LGKVYDVLGKYEYAVSYYAEAVRLKPDAAVANFGLGEACRKTDRPKEAAAAYQRYLWLEPTGQLANSARKYLRELQSR
jgi:tetratricopeptide (TPR) repeat protein